MPAWRKLHVKITESLDVNEIPNDFMRLLWVMLTLAVDREGRGLDNPSWVKAKTMPLRVDVVIEQIEQAMNWFADHGMIERYHMNGRCYFWIPTWRIYQGDTSREAESNFPDPHTCDNRDDSCPIPETDGGDGIATQELVMTNSRPTHELVMHNSCSDADADADADAERDSATQTVAPPRPPPQKRAKLARAPTPAAVTVFREAAHRFPAKSWWSDVDRIVGENPDDLQFWEQIVKAWVGLGWNPTNVAGMLEFYGRREIPAVKARAGLGPSAVDRSLAAIKAVTGVDGRISRDP